MDHRTNIVLDRDLLAHAKRLTGIHTTRAVVHEALRLLIKLNEQQKLRGLRGELTWEGDLSEQREGRIHAAG
jgi:Arc/MetJ family transcription regulator